MTGKPLASVFGVRHLSPAAAIHLGGWLEEVKPDIVLVEGPSDATDQIVHLGDDRTRPPVAILSFTRARPVRSILYPLAAYSPEWVALRYALGRRIPARFIDLPTSVFLALHGRRDAKAAAGGAEGGGERAAASPSATEAYLDDPYEAIARLSGEIDHDTWWERHFEHTREVAAYRDAIFEFGKGLREVRRRDDDRERETLLREAYMRRKIAEAIGEGFSRPVVVCGAYHAPVLTDAEAPMTDAEHAALPRLDCMLTLMPYSYPRLSAQSGYGAGNYAPSYFEALYQESCKGSPDRLRARYASSIAGELRRGGLVRSSAEVIEVVRLAEGLAAIAGSPTPTLRDLRDAAITLLGHGEKTPLTDALAAVEIGTSVGALPKGVTRTALQEDFHQLVETLRLERYVDDRPQEIELDLREDRFAKTRDRAFLDRSRSTFLHRLAVLDIGFGAARSRAQRGTAREKWALRWTPECEIRLAERSLAADSIEMAAAYALSEELAAAKDVGGATTVLLRAASAQLADALGTALARVQELTVDEGGFGASAIGIENLAELVRYGDVRDVDPAPLRPILAQLYLRATLLLAGATVCDEDAAKGVRAAMDRVHAAAFLGEEGIDVQRWIDALGQVAASDTKNPFLSGYAAALLIERGQLGDEEIDREVSRRLSPGTDASLGVGWFEGLVQRNVAALFMRRALWAALSAYVDDLEGDGFRRALLYLRRAFSGLERGEVRRLVGILAELWKGQGVADLAAAVERTLDETEVAAAAVDLEGLEELDL